jgi:hypothetical protein
MIIGLRIASPERDKKVRNKELFRPFNTPAQRFQFMVQGIAAKPARRRPELASVSIAIAARGPRFDY